MHTHGRSQRQDAQQSTLFPLSSRPSLRRGPSPPAARNAPSGTSSRAAKTISRDVNRLRSRVLAVIVNAGQRGVTDAEIQEQLDMAGNTERPRRRELLQLGFIADSGRRRLTPAGRSAAIWIAVTAEMGDASA